MPGKLSTSLLVAVALIIIISGVMVYFVLKDRGHKLVTGSEASMADDEAESLIFSEMFSARYDLESPADLENYTVVDTGKASSGKNSCWLNPKTEYSVTVSRKLSTVKDFQRIQQVVFSFSVYTETPLKNAVAVLSIDGPDGKSIVWAGRNINVGQGAWQQVEYSLDVNKSKFTGDASIKLYVWNKSGEEFFIDDLSVSINGLVSSRNMVSNYIPERNIEYDFEVPFEGENPDYYSTKKAHSGKFSYLLDNSTTYSPAITKKISDVIDTELKLITMSIWLNQQSDNNEVLLVATIRDARGKEYFWQGRSSEKGKFPEGEWVKLRAQFKLPFDKINPNDLISVYAWNKGGKKVYVDDLLVVFGETNVRSGKSPAMDMTTIGEEGFVFTGNKPPFKIKYLQSISSINQGEFERGDRNLIDDIVLPAEPMCAGTFIPSMPGREQLVRISEASMYVYDYCAPQKKMNRIAKLDNAVFGKFSLESTLASGNFTSISSQSIMLADVGRKLIVIGELTALKEGCSIGQIAAFQVIHQLSKEQYRSLLPGTYSRMVTGDFNGDKFREVLLINPASGGFALLSFKNKSPELIAYADTSATIKTAGFGKGFSVNTIRWPENNQDIIVLSYYERGINRSKALVFDKVTESFTAITSWSSKMISGECNIYQGEYFAKDGQILMLNRSWKFDFVSGEIDQQELYFDSRLEFTGFTPGYNPKFYEDVKIIPGRFIDDKKEGLLVVTGHCIDSSFPSKPCKDYETASGWKPRAQLYYFKD